MVLPCRTLKGRIEVKSHNPVLSRLGQAAERERAAAYAPAGPYGPPVGQPYPTGQAYPAAPPAVAPMTIDDVVVRTVTLLGLTGLSGGLAWVLVPDRLTMPIWITAAVVGLVLGLVIAFARITNPLVIGAYAVVEGVFLGLVSRYYESVSYGIVLQAVIGTFGVFFLMAMLYKAKVIRATPKFVRGVIAAMVGVFALMLINLVLGLFGFNTHLRDGSPIAIGFSLIVIVIAALTFILDFHQVEEGVRYGLPRKYAWACAFGILVSLIWLYLEILRLLSYFQGDD
jgi:uncharacterized YccA/Bax inhibitor family protein